jgi:hypothetical protein
VKPNFEDFSQRAFESRKNKKIKEGNDKLMVV